MDADLAAIAAAARAANRRTLEALEAAPPPRIDPRDVARLAQLLGVDAGELAALADPGDPQT